MKREHVLTVHGINSDGAWQNEVMRVLKPHFDSITEFKYFDYRELGFLKVILDPGILLLLLATTYATLILDGLGVISFNIRLGVALLVTFVLLSYFRAGRRRKDAVLRFKKELDKTSSSLPRHIIAHSFGTFLVGRALLKWPALSFQRIVLCGGVLPTWFDWEKLRRANPECFKDVRNEVGRKDRVSLLAFLIYPLVRGLGCSGALGFWKGTGFWRSLRQTFRDTGFVHSTDTPYGPCIVCRKGGRARIHNVRINEFAHSDQFIGTDHAATFWLPFLWGIEPGEFRKWLRLCHVASSLVKKDPGHPDLLILEKELGERDWTFLGRTLNQELSRFLGRDPTAPVISYVARLIWSAVDEANVERFNSEPRPEVVKALDPTEAIASAVSVVRRNAKN